MIIFTTIRYKNFLSTGNMFLEIPLNQHNQTLILGANGQGKCLEKFSKIKVRNKITGEIKDISIGDFYELQKK